MRVDALPFVLLVALAGCGPEPVAWSDPQPISPVDGPSRLVVDSTGAARFVPDAPKPATMPSDPGLCAATVKTSEGESSIFASWWRARSDSSAALYLAKSSDGGHSWLPAMAVDTTDVSSNGCARPAPALTTVGDDVFVAYSMIAPEGKGVFFVHTMGGMLHTPVPVIYGE